MPHDQDAPKPDQKISMWWADSGRTILQARYPNRLHWPTIVAHVQEMWRWLDTVAHMVSFVLDVGQVRYFPPGYVEHVSKIEETMHPRVELVVLMGSPLVWELRTIYDEQFNERPHPFAYADDLQMAYALIQQFRRGGSLGALQPPKHISN
ncbi:MAG: hypothetical protein GYB67_11350 [Chloroflexi bacterium]|nr:hypothetical protein [Chloroflexota bacterium]